MTINTQTFEGLTGGMDLNIPAHDLPTNKARYLQDVLLDVPGMIRRRGLIQILSGYSASIGFRASGITSATDPAGVTKIAILAGDGTNGKIHYLTDPFTGSATSANLFTDHAKTTALTMPTTAGLEKVVDAHPALGGGALIGISSKNHFGAVQPTLYYWRGATKADFTSGAIWTVTGGGSNSRTMTASGDQTANIEVGMFVFTNASPNELVGMIAAMDYNVTTASTTTITLEDKAQKGLAAAIANFRALRGIQARYSTGTIAVALSGTAVTGTGTKFLSWGVNNGTWDIYLMSDMSFVGVVTAVASETDLTIGAGANMKVTASDKYVLVKRGAATLYDGNVAVDNSRFKLGFINAVWGGRQWYANRPTTPSASTTAAVRDETARVWFSDVADLESVDTSTTGDYINIASTGTAPSPVMAMAATANGLAVLKERELYTIVGTDRTNFIPRKIASIGTIATGSVQQYGGGIVFAAREGIFYFDGTRLENLAESLGQEYASAVKAFNTATHRCWSMMTRDHYIVNINSYAPVTKPIINGSTFSRTEMQFIINMRTGAIGTLTNHDVRGSVQLPTSTGLGTLFVTHTSAPLVKLCDAQYLWTGTGIDGFTCLGSNQIGPWFYVESRKYDLGDGERKKLFKQIAMTYSLSGAVLGMDTIPGLTSTGTRTSTDWQTNADFTNKRIKFLKRSTHLAFRFYEVTAGGMTDLKIGPHAIGYKLQRPGRV